MIRDKGPGTWDMDADLPIPGNYIVHAGERLENAAFLPNTSIIRVSSVPRMPGGYSPDSLRNFTGI